MRRVLTPLTVFAVLLLGSLALTEAFPSAARAADTKKVRTARRFPVATWVCHVTREWVEMTPDGPVLVQEGRVMKLTRRAAQVHFDHGDFSAGGRPGALCRRVIPFD